MNEIMSATAFTWILTGLVGGLSAVWLVYDARNLWRARAADGSDPLVRDRRFGYSIGIVIALIGLLGTLRFHGVV
jgi:hypothetical protein